MALKHFLTREKERWGKNITKKEKRRKKKKFFFYFLDWKASYLEM